MLLAFHLLQAWKPARERRAPPCFPSSPAATLNMELQILNFRLLGCKVRNESKPRQALVGRETEMKAVLKKGWCSYLNGEFEDQATCQ